MSQKTNPISLRLQKTNISFPLSLFADYFLSDIYQTCFENQNYLAAFLKESCYSQAIFSARVFYRKFSVFLFVQDNRVSKKNALFFFKNKGQRTPSPLMKKDNAFLPSSSFSLGESLSSSIHRKEDIESFERNRNYFLKKKHSFFSPKMIEQPTSSVLENASFYVVKVLQHDFLKIKQGFFKEFSFVENKKENSLANTSFLDSMVCMHKKSPLAFTFTSFGKEEIAYNYLSDYISFYLSTRGTGKSSQNLLSFKTFARSSQKKKQLEIVDLCGISNSLERKEISTSSEKRNLKYSILSKNNVLSSTKIFSRPCLSFCEEVMSLKKKRFLANFSLNNVLLSYKDEKRFPLLLSHINNDNLTAKRKQSFFRNYLSKKDLSFFPIQTTLEPIRFLNEDQNVMAVLDIVVALLEKRIAFRQIKSFLFRQLSLKPQFRGIRISCSGRLGGRSKKAQKAKVQCDSFGTTTLSTFSSKIIFGSKSALTPYGKIGVKIWLSYKDTR